MDSNCTKKIFEGCILLSDLDGTMITSDYTLPVRNVEAVKRFRQKGGRVILATGRSRKSARPFVERLGVTEPCVIFNGAAAYDYEKSEYLLTRPIERDIALSCMRRLIELFPEMGAEVLTEDRLYMVRDSERARYHARNEGEPFCSQELEKTPEKWLKVVLSGEPSMMDDVVREVQPLLPEGLRAIKSMNIYAELLRCDVDKFSMASELFDCMGISDNRIFGIGDYFNDVEMIRAAECGAAPSNAPEAVRAQADFIACAVEDGAVADFIEYLEDKMQ
ncbi:MAG: HAD family hydrolase [Clostridia bacterium]|nr:HAD family hydrolase [Clostridia bacterium]